MFTKAFVITYIRLFTGMVPSPLGPCLSDIDDSRPSKCLLHHLQCRCNIFLAPEFLKRTDTWTHVCAKFYESAHNFNFWMPNLQNRHFFCKFLCKCVSPNIWSFIVIPFFVAFLSTHFVKVPRLEGQK